ncbi:hypothetical protein C8R46DRAFT_487936 [Mycena filopes]|nr:hypothetical protein C8R46DRAFT_487936 [Mycena filopes]
MVLRRLCPLGLYTFAALNNILTEAAPLPAIRPVGLTNRAPRFGRPHPRQDEIGSLVANITGQTASDPAALAQTLGSLFGGSDNSSSPTPTVSDDPLSQAADTSLPSITALDGAPSAAFGDPLGVNASDSDESIVSQFTSTATYPAPTGDLGNDPWALLSQIVGALPTSLPLSDPTGEDVGDSSSPSGMAPQQLINCAETYTVVAGDTCDAVSSVFGLSLVEFLRMNPSVGAACMNLQLGQEYCVRRSAGGSEDAHDEDGGYRQNTVVNINNYPGNYPAIAPPGGVVAPAIPSAPSASTADLPVPLPLPPTTPGLNSTDTSSTDDPSLNSTDSSSSTTADPSLDSTDSSSTGLNSTASITGHSSALNSTGTASSGTSDPESSPLLAGDPSSGDDTLATVTSLDTPVATPALNGTDTSAAGDENEESADDDATGMAARASASSGPKKVEMEWKVEEDF